MESTGGAKEGGKTADGTPGKSGNEGFKLNKAA